MHEIQKVETGPCPHRSLLSRGRTSLHGLAYALRGKAVRARRGLRSMLAEESGQGTTEYAILVGVLVVIAILAIIAFRDKVGELWDAIASGINDL